MLIRIIFILIYFTVFTVVADTTSPYKGQQQRNIKALSQSDIDGYLNGKGMGFAKAAELNHYPGPLHVLELEKELKLAEKQKKQTQELFNSMQTRAIELGKQIVEKEEKLDSLFANSTVEPDSLQKVLLEIGKLQASLRYVHLNAHLKQKQILTRHQVMQYDQLRGYGKGKHSEHHHSH